MIEKKLINLSYLLIFLIFTVFYYTQLVNQHWSAILDQDLVIIYNSLLISSGLEQEYRDHPAYTTFLLNGLIYKLIGFLSIQENNIDEILIGENINQKLQFFFYLSRLLGFFIHIVLVFFINGVLKKLRLDYRIRFFICLTFCFSVGYISSLYLIRSEAISLLFFTLSVYFLLKKNNLLTNIFVSGVFFSFAMLAKIQIIFLFIYIIYLIPNLNFSEKLKFDNKYLRNYLLFSIILIFLCLLSFQIYIQEFPRFQNNKYIDLIIYVLFFITIIFYFFFKENLIKNWLALSLFFHGFLFFILIVILLDQINFIKLNYFILLRITNPIHYMTEFEGNFSGGIVTLNYFIKNLIQFISSYKFSLLELFFIIYLVIVNKKNRYWILFFIFAINCLVYNFRYQPVYHLYYSFLYLIMVSTIIQNLKYKKALIFCFIPMFLFVFYSVNFFIFSKNKNFAYQDIFNRDIGIKKVCNQIILNEKPNSYESIEFVTYWHSKLNKKNITKICNEIF